MATDAAHSIRRLALSQLISRAGSNGAVLAVQYSIWTRTHSAAWLSVSLLVAMGARLLAAAPAGQLSDRFDRKHVMISSEAIGASLWVAAIFLSAPAALVALSGAAMVAQSPFRPALTASVAQIARADGLVAANAAIARADAAGLVIGPPVAGLLIGLSSPQLVFGVNALSFAVSVLILASLRGGFQPTTGGDASDKAGLAGVRYLRRDRDLMFLASGAFFVLASSGLVNVAEPQLATALRSGAIGYGLLSGGWALGTLAGSVIAARTRHVRDWARSVLAVGLLGAGGATVTIALAPNLVVTLPLMVAMGAGMGIFFIGQSTIVQRRVPDPLVGRVFAAVDAVGSCAFILGTACSALVINTLGVRGSYVISGLLLVLAAPAVAGLRHSSSDDAWRGRPYTRAAGIQKPSVDTRA